MVGSSEPIIDDENPEWTEEDFAKARPFKDVFPQQYASWKHVGERAASDDRAKVHIGFRLAADVVAGVKATGRGYSARVERVLRAALARGEL